MKENTKSPIRGEVATVYFTNNVSSGPMPINKNDGFVFDSKHMCAKIDKADGRVYIIPFTSIAFIRAEPEQKEETPVEEKK